MHLLTVIMFYSFVEILVEHQNQAGSLTGTDWNVLEIATGSSVSCGTSKNLQTFVKDK